MMTKNEALERAKKRALIICPSDTYLTSLVLFQMNGLINDIYFEQTHFSKGANHLWWSLIGSGKLPWSYVFEAVPREDGETILCIRSQLLARYLLGKNKVM